MKRLLVQAITGISIPQEYVCVCAEDLETPFSLMLVDSRGKECGDVTTSHVLLGYKPLVVGLPATPTLEANPTIKLSLRFLNTRSRSEEVAFLILRKSVVKTSGTQKVIFYEGTAGAHKFIAPWRQSLNRWYSKYEQKPVDNVTLDSNLYDQVRIAYAIPRSICLITVHDGNRINTFPTDLHGRVGEDLYVSSLRKDGRACSQVMEHKRVLLTEMDLSQYREVYALGKNHMREMQAQDTSAEPNRSCTFHFPIPAGAGTYLELEAMDHHDIGIHRLLLYRIVNLETVAAVKPLAHMHRFAIQWRLNHGLVTNVLLR